ncbi:AAA family ATPase [Paratractidigestivibacter sp.]|uniref:AAA family ATPase n=1 Tax=Paratractidigestivibacter sp. TaxID=2847316 RepID=UPI002AC9E35F|nr:AAA family ATPase [Paratractidigestivibacter sp.]
MKKRNVINLIRYHEDHNEAAFRSEAAEIARDFDASGDEQLAEYIMALISDANAFVPQSAEEGGTFFDKMDPSSTPLPLPQVISDDVTGVCNAIAHNAGVNKFLFQGPPGTGKTESARQIARITARDLYRVDFNLVVDSKLGQTAKNIGKLFREINSLRLPDKAIILFDEIDALALDRVNQQDVREMGRATSALLKELDGLNEQVVLIATTNLYKELDKALVRRFDATIDFGRYDREDLIDISEVMLSGLLQQFKGSGRNMRLFRKIISQMAEVPYPGDLRNMLKSALAFSNPDEPYDYLRRVYKQACPSSSVDNLAELRSQGFTVREMEALSGVSKSTISRELKETAYE